MKSCFAVLAVVLISSCSVNRFAVNTATRMLASPGGSSVFTSDNDPELIADALPLVLKLTEAMLSQSPENTDLLVVTGSLCVMYANAFIQGPADRLPLEEFREQEAMRERARKMYIRAWGYLERALVLRYPRMATALEDHGYSREVFSITRQDVALCYWSAAALMSAFSLNPFDFEMNTRIPVAFALATAGLLLDETWNNGAFHELFLSIHGSLPDSLKYDYLYQGDNPVAAALAQYYGGLETAPEKLDFHFDRVMTLTDEGSASAFVAMANAAAVPAQDVDLYREYLEKALAIDVDGNPDNRLMNILAQQKAAWMLDHLDDYFILP